MGVGDPLALQFLFLEPHRKRQITGDWRSMGARKISGSLLFVLSMLSTSDSIRFQLQSTRKRRRRVCVCVGGGFSTGMCPRFVPFDSRFLVGISPVRLSVLICFTDTRFRCEFCTNHSTERMSVGFSRLDGKGLFYIVRPLSEYQQMGV